MLNEITFARATDGYFRKCLSHYLQLVVTRKNLLALFLSGLAIFLFYDLRVILQNVRQAARRKNALPKIICFKSVGVGWISCSIIPALIERKKPRGFSFQMRAKHDFAFVQCEMRHTTT